jgi:hypothetical protein
MKIKKRKLVLRLVLCILGGLFLIALAGGTVVYFTQPILIGHGKGLQITQEPDMSATLTKAQASADAAQMTSFLEEVHPLFLNKETAKYRQDKNAYLFAAKNSMTVADFALLTSKFLTTLDDGHTRLYWAGSAELPVNWQWVDGTLMVGAKCSLPEGAQVISVGGAPVSAIASVVDRLFPAENDAAARINRETYIKNQSALQAAGVNTADKVTIEFSDHGAVSEKALSFSDPSGNSTSYQPYVEGTIEKGAFVITLRSCILSKELDQTVTAMKEAVADGYTKVVVDVRDNPGGNSDACKEILNALGMRTGTYGGIVRFSKPASQQRGYLRQSGGVSFKANNDAKPNNKIQLYVITNENTFSSATMLAVWVQDGHLGKIVGSPSANSPSSYGDVINFQLNNSKLYGIVSHKQWIRPDVNKINQKELVPDIPVPDSGDALATALDAKN